jgi:hypothetical protein
MDGKCNEAPFAYLSHSAEIYEKGSEQQTLVKLIKTIVRNIDRYNTRSNNKHFEVVETNDLRLLSHSRLRKDILHL